MSIPAGGYQLVYVTGKSTVSQSGSDVLTSLTFSKNGGSVVLLDTSGNIASAVQYPRYSSAAAAPAWVVAAVHCSCGSSSSALLL